MQPPDAIGDLPYEAAKFRCCKVLWSVICGTTSRCDKDLVISEINDATQLLEQGINYFKSFTEASLQKVLKSNLPPRMYDLVGKLARLLNLDAEIAWGLTFNYMSCEYRNSGKKLASQLSDTTSMRILIEDIWNFYYFERLTLIKCLKLMTEYRNNDRHPHSREFAKFFDAASPEKLLKSIGRQVDGLKFISPPNRDSGVLDDRHLHRLYSSSLAETRELLHVLTVLLDEVRPTPSEFEALYGSILGEPRRLVSSKSHEDKELVAKKLEEIRHSQTALLLVSMDVVKHAGMEHWIKQLRSIMQDTLEHKCVKDSSTQDGPFLMAWMLANYAIEPDNPETLNKYRPFGVRAIQLDVFHQIRSLVDSEMISEDTKYAKVVRSSVYNFFTVLCSFIDDAKMSSFNGIFEAVGSVLSYPEIAAKFWKECGQDEGVWPFYNRAVVLFPYRFKPLTVIATGLARASKSSAEQIANALENLDSVTLELPHNRGNTWTSLTTIKPYERECIIHKNDFTIDPTCERAILEESSSSSSTTETNVVIFATNSRYSDAFHHKIEQLLSQSGGGIANVSDVKTSLPDHVSQGFALLEALLATDLEITPGMIIPTEMSLEIINRFSYPVLPTNIYKIVAACCRVATKLVIKYPDEILSRMRVGVYPRFNDNYQTTKDLARAVSFDGGLVASWLSGIESIQHRYPILNAYLDTLSNYLVMRHSTETMRTIEIPGMVFLLQGVLPKLDSWYFASESERIDLWYKGMSCLHRALDSNLPKGEPRKQLQYVVAYSLLYLEPRHALLKLVRTGEKNLQQKMMNETDWLSGKGYKIIRSVQLALSLVNRLLMFRHSLGVGRDERSPLEIDLYASPCMPNGLLIVPTIVNYLYVWFSPSLQAMAVRLLKKFAEGFSMSLLVCMGMDGTAIRETFASRLMLPTCSAKVKVAILELVAVCLERQPGLTEALFNIMHRAERKRIFPRSADQFLTEGCSQFIDIYLHRIADEDDIVYDRLYDSTMSLLRAMWYNRNEILVNYFRKREKFWTQLFAPLFRPLVARARGYAQLVDILTLELFECCPPSAREDDFSRNVETLLVMSDHWERLIAYVLVDEPTITKSDASFHGDNDGDCFVDKVEAPLYEANIEAWYNFIVTLTDPRIASNVIRKVATSRIQSMMKIIIESLSVRIKKTRDIVDARIIMLLASLALRCVTTWKNECVKEPKTFLHDIVQLMQDIVHSYGAYGVALRRTLVALLLGCLQLVKTTIANDTASLEYMLAQTCALSMIELRKLEENAQKNWDERNDVVEEVGEADDDDSSPKVDKRSRGTRLGDGNACGPATITVSMVIQLLRCDDDNFGKQTSRLVRRSTCLQLRQIIPQLMTYLGMTLRERRCLAFSKAGLGLLGAIARSPYYSPSAKPRDDEEAVAKLWLALVPPDSLGNSMVDSLYDDQTGHGLWRCRDWWSIYTLGLEFVTGLVSFVAGTNVDPKSGSAPSCPSQVEPIILFLGSHENQMVQVATLLRHTADPLAIDLVNSLVALVSALTVRPTLWESVQPTVRDSLMKCMYLVYDSTVNLLLRPRILKFIIDGVSVESAEELQSCDDKILSTELRLVVNKLIVINWWCAQCFVRFSPRLNALVDTIYTQDFWYAPLAEMNFGPPQMSINSAPRLTYGTIISSTQLFAQALYSRSSKTIGTTSAAAVGSALARRSTSLTENVDSAKREWERATPENPRKIHAHDLRRILQMGRPTSTVMEFSSFVTGHDVTLPLLSNRRLLRRPYDPLICENSILSRATSFGHQSASRQAVAKNNQSTQNSNERGTTINETNPWFASMNENNATIALEVNLVLVLCQTLEGVKSPRLALRDRQLIARETANEIGLFFDFFDQRNDQLEQSINEGALVDSDSQRVNNDEIVDVVRKVRAPEKGRSTCEFTARLVRDSTVNKVPVCNVDHSFIDDSELTNNEFVETRLDDDIVTTGHFLGDNKSVKFLPLLGKLLKSMLESLDSAQYS